MSSSSTRTAASAGLTLKIVNPLVEAVTETFSTMLGCEVERVGLELRGEDAKMLDISALIGVSGRASGSFCLSFEADTAAGAVSRYTGMEVYPESPLVVDGVGEFTNVIIGTAKDKLDIPLNLGIPNVVLGEDHSIAFPNESKPMRVKFQSDLGPLLVDFGFTTANIEW